MSRVPWPEVEARLREQAYGTLDDDPQILLEEDGGPVGEEAELIYARLIGFEDEIVRDGMPLPRVEPRILVPIPQGWEIFDDQIAPGLYRLDGVEIYIAPEPMRTAVYELQSGFVMLRVSAEFLPPDVPVGPDGTARVLYLRYRRRS